MMKRYRSVASGSTIEGGGAIVVSPSRVQETGCGTIRANLAAPNSHQFLVGMGRC
jgi:hypothetical protein